MPQHHRFCVVNRADPNRKWDKKLHVFGQVDFIDVDDLIEEASRLQIIDELYEIDEEVDDLELCESLPLLNKLRQPVSFSLWNNVENVAILSDAIDGANDPVVDVLIEFQILGDELADTIELEQALGEDGDIIEISGIGVEEDSFTPETVELSDFVVVQFDSLLEFNQCFA